MTDARPIEVLVYQGGLQLGPRGYPRDALVDPDIPEKFPRLATYVTPDKKTIRTTVGDMWAIYRLIGFTFAGDQIWRLLATRYARNREIQFRDDAGDEELRKQIEGWLLNGEGKDHQG